MLPHYYYSLLDFFVVVAFNLIFNLFNFSCLLHLTLCLTTPPLCTCIYTVVLVVLLITDEGNRRLPKRLEESVSLRASVSEQPKHESS